MKNLTCPVAEGLKTASTTLRQRAKAALGTNVHHADGYSVASGAVLRVLRVHAESCEICLQSARRAA